MIKSDVMNSAESDVVQSGSDVEMPEVDDGSKTNPRSGMADVMAKILSQNIGDKCPILAKCKSDKQRQLTAKKRQDTADSNVKESGGKVAAGSKVKVRADSKSMKTDKVVVIKDEQWSESSDDETISAKARHKLIVKRKRWEELGRVKPSVLDKDREKNLQRLATKGVVQLFNAVRKQQVLLEDRLKEVGPSEGKREKVVQSMTKGKFLDLLKNTKTETVRSSQPAPEIKSEPEDTSDNDEQPATWSILRDDFMMGAKMKDWDKRPGSDAEAGDDDSSD